MHFMPCLGAAAALALLTLRCVVFDLNRVDGSLPSTCKRHQCFLVASCSSTHGELDHHPHCRPLAEDD